MSIFITGTAGFIGFHVAYHLLKNGNRVIGLDNVNDYYDVTLKEARLEILNKYAEFEFVRAGLHDTNVVKKVFEIYHPDVVINLAAQAGVRYSSTNPYVFLESNILGFLNILEACRYNGVKHLIFASSSSVYGLNAQPPFKETDDVNHPVSLYAASKKSNELMAYSYAYLYNLPISGLRFFTVYGPWGRPDMAYFKFLRAILDEQTIQVFNHGNHSRDLTYIDDVVNSITRIINLPPLSTALDNSNLPQASDMKVPYCVYNVGNNKPIKLMHIIETLEKELGKTAKKEFLSIQAGDMVTTCADVDSLAKRIQFLPSTPFRVGLKKFVKWYLEFYS
ncbi:MAG: UDP-N-acetylglucosamine 4-epimerase [Hyphomicrobiaceae bacterium hypho_1]